MTQEHRLAAVVSVYHNKLMCGFDETRAFIDYMAGERVPIWDIPIAGKLIRKHLDKHVPWLKEYTVDPDAKPDTYPKFVRQMVSIHGEDKIAVQPLRVGDYKPRDVKDIF